MYHRSQIQTYVAFTLSIMSIFLYIYTLNAPKSMMISSILHTPTCFLAGASIGHVSHAALMLWGILALMCSWIADGMLWHNKCSSNVGRNDHLISHINEDIISSDKCDEYIFVLRAITGLFASIEVL